MTENESKRIASLTTGAIQTTMENAAKAMMAAVEAAEEKARELREATEQFIEDSVKVTGELADNVNAHIVACQAAIDSFQAHHLKILNVDPPVNIVPVEPHQELPREKTLPEAQDLDALKQLALRAVK